MGSQNALFREDIFNRENITQSIEVLKILLKQYPAIHKLNYQYATDTLTAKQITGNNKSIDIKLLVEWGIINKVGKDAYKLNTPRILTFSAVILLLQS